MPKQDKNAKNMPGHASRIKKGRLRKLRSDTKMGTLEKRYNTKFPGRSDMKWGKFKKKFKVGSINEAREKHGG